MNLKSKKESDGKTVEYVVFIHAFDWEEQGNGKKYRLLVSKYSFLKSSTLFDIGTEVAGNQELLLHFGDFGSMGERQDAEIIDVSDIIHAQDLESNPSSSADIVEHTGPCPPGMN